MTQPPAASTAPESPEPSPTLLSLIGTVAARWRLIVLMAVTGAVVAAAWALLATPRFRATGRYALEERNPLAMSAGIAALAGQLGAGSLTGARSLQFYAEVLVGRDLLEEIALDTFPDPARAGARAPLIDILRVGPDSPRKRLSAAVLRLGRLITTSTNDRTGTITLDVVMPDAELAADVGSRLYQELEHFNAETRGSAARRRREFADRELTRARGELAGAEGGMRQFLEANRDGLNTPRLAFLRQQLQRKIELATELYSQFARELEEARIDEVRDTPVFTIVERPEAPAYREFPRRVRMVLLGGFLGAALAMAWVIAGFIGWSARVLGPSGLAALRGGSRHRAPGTT